MCIHTSLDELVVHKAVALGQGATLISGHKTACGAGVEPRVVAGGEVGHHLYVSVSWESVWQY